MFKKIALALAFSPTCSALLSEAKRIAGLFQARLILIHVGPKTETSEAYLRKLLEDNSISYAEENIIWREGKPSKEILGVCKKENVDLLVAGALKRENIFVQYLGSVARKILRKSSCSVLVLTNPCETPKPFREIVIDVEDHTLTRQVVETGIYFARTENASLVHLVKEIELYGLSLSITSESTERERANLKKRIVRQELNKLESVIENIDINNLKINYKILAGKSGFELARFTKRLNADLLVVGAYGQRFDIFDRVFTHDLEYIFADLPSNLLVVKTK